ncbi:MAG: ATP-dependent protease ATPase subunit HslU, partial [Mesotoga sp.]|nr:ATP-dependent protease ATPase subunit HslU [Mesotoga sp.]
MNREELDELTPKRIVEELNKYIVGQDKAKRAVAVAMRNRIRRQKLPEEIRRDVIPKNILMMGPTGVGKTEIARRLAELTGSPFTKVEATRFTEVGYVGKNVESIIRELVDVGVNMVKQEKMGEVEGKASYQVEERILEALVPGPQTKATGPRNIIELFQGQQQPKPSQEETERIRNRREDYRDRLRSGDLEDLDIEVEVEDHSQQMIMIPGMEDMGIDMSGVLGGMVPKKTKRRKMRIADARKTLLPIEAEKLLDMDKVVAEAIDRVQNRGMVFIDEIDKISARGEVGGPDVSREGVQRDLLPLIEGTMVSTKHGTVKTDHILFIASGAFHTAKPSDLLPELQGRLPNRVELKALSADDFVRILVEPETNLIRQYQALLKTEGVELTFKDDAIRE